MLILQCPYTLWHLDSLWWNVTMIRICSSYWLLNHLCKVLMFLCLPWILVLLIFRYHILRILIFVGNSILHLFIGTLFACDIWDHDIVEGIVWINQVNSHQWIFCNIDLFHQQWYPETLWFRIFDFTLWTLLFDELQNS